MAIALRGASAALGTGTTSVAVNAPAGFTTGDVLIAFIVDEATGATQTSAPTGWLPLTVAAGTGGRCQAFYAVEGQNGLTGTSWTWSGLTTTASGVIVGYSGVDNGRPFDCASTARRNASGTTGTTAITTVTANTMVVAAFASVNNGCTWSAEACATSPTLTERFDAANGTTHSIAIADGAKAAAGATGVSSATMSANEANVGILLALAPESAGVKVTKTVGYAVISVPPGVLATKVVGYAVMSPPTTPPPSLYPSENDVRDGVQYGPGAIYTGNMIEPAVGDVRSGVGYDSNGTVTGTLALPAVGNVRSTIQYGAGGTEFTGTVTLPAQSDVRNTVQYGAGGTEFTGTYTGGGGSGGAWTWG